MPIYLLPPAAPAPATAGASAGATVEVAIGAIDHVAAAINRLPVQFRNKPKIEAFLRALVQPVQEVENAFQQLLRERAIDTAIGAQLDAIGFIVGQTRQGFGDDDYRRLVRARISTNKSRGNFEDLIQITRLVIDDDGATIVAQRSGIATVTIRVEDVAVAAGVAAILIGFLRLAKMGGVRLVFEYGTTPPAGWFTWGSAGLGYGISTDAAHGGKMTAAR